MAVLKNKTDRKNYLVVSKIFLQDRNLSLTERGLLATMHSLPDEWEFTIKGMQKILPDGETKIKTALDGLIQKGYVYKRQRVFAGKFGRNIVEIYESPLAEKPGSENLIPDKTVVENPVASNQAQYSNKGCIITKYNNKECNINPSIHQSGQTDTIDNYKAIIAENINLDKLIQIASCHNEDEVQMVREIYHVICVMVCYPKQEVKIKGETYPWTHVKEQFFKLRYENIASVLNRIVDANLNIKKMDAYLVSTLYTESMVGTLEAQSKMTDDYLRHLRGNPY